jgi:hypothetical protein
MKLAIGLLWVAARAFERPSAAKAQLGVTGCWPPPPQAASSSGVSLRRQPVRPVRLSTSAASSR